MRRLSALLLAASLFTPTPEARACFAPGTLPFEVDLAEVGVDTTPPSAIPAVDVSITRGEGTAGCAGKSTDDTGFLSLAITPPDDDRSAADDLGYRVRLVGGELPGDMRIEDMEGVWVPGYENDKPSTSGVAELVAYWGDSHKGLQEGFGFTLEIAAVDKAGNEGPALLVVVSDPGALGGCTLAWPRRPASVALPLLLTLGLLVAGRRRRARGDTP